MYRAGDLPLCIHGYHGVIYNDLPPLARIVRCYLHVGNNGWADSNHWIDGARNCGSINLWIISSRLVALLVALCLRATMEIRLSIMPSAFTILRDHISFRAT